MGTKVLKAFESYGFLERDTDSGKREFHATKNGNLAYNAIMTCWTVSPSFRKLLEDTSPLFHETGLPLVAVSEVETYGQKVLREQRDDGKNKISLAEQVRLFGQGTVDQHNERIRSLVGYWRKRPLVFPDGNATSCATRIFSDGSLKVGGRLYGSWTNLPNDERLQCT